MVTRATLKHKECACLVWPLQTSLETLTMSRLSITQLQCKSYTISTYNVFFRGWRWRNKVSPCSLQQFFFRCFLSALGWICRYCTHGQGLTMLMIFKCTTQKQMYTDSHSDLLFLLEWNHDIQHRTWTMESTFANTKLICVRNRGISQILFNQTPTEFIEGKGGSMLIIKLEQFTFLITWRGQTGHILTEYLSSPQCLFLPLFA